MKLNQARLTTSFPGIGRAATLRSRSKILAAGLLALVGTLSVNATQVIRELWDGPNTKFALDGAWGGGVSSFGVAPGTNWVTSPPGNTSLRYDGTWNLDWEVGDGDVLLPYSAGHGGTLAYYGGDGNMGSTLINPATGVPYGHWSSQCYATRALATNSYINFNADGTYYFSVRFIGGGGYNWWSGDLAGGIGLASSGQTNAHFVGAGWTRNSYLAEDGVTDIGKSAYISTGTLDQPGIASHPDDSGGPYYARTNGPARALARIDSGSGLEYGTGALLVGQIITTSGGAATMNVKLFFPYAGIPTDPSTITWDATYNFTETNVMTRLLAWQYGTGPSVQDAIRLGTTYGDAVGLEIVGAPNANPGTTVYAGTAVTFSITYAGLNTGPVPMTYQWFSNGVPVIDATNATLALASTTTDSTADYILAVSNLYGMITSAVTHLTVNPAVRVFVTAQPASINRYVGGSASFTVGVDGTPPFGLQLKHAGTNVPGGAMQLSGPGLATLTVAPLAATDGGAYSVFATNQFGTTNSQTANLTLVTPATGSFEAAAVAAGAVAFWPLTETTNDWTAAGVPLHEYKAGLYGNCPDTNNTSFGVPGPNFPGFDAQTAIGTWNNGNSSQINLPGMKQYSNTMTMMCWMKASFLGSQAIMLDTDKSGNGLGDGPYFGIDYRLGSLGSQWGDTNSVWGSGITLPLNQWVMVALVVEPNETTVYAGTDPFTLQMMARSTLEGFSYANIDGTLSNGRLALGRTDYAWANFNNSWAGMNAQFSDAAVFYTALQPAAITNLFLAGVGVQIGGAPDGAAARCRKPIR
jgi:Concanavalin A-like lectin/glucanases superfamily